MHLLMLPEYETKVVDIVTGITAKATHRNNWSTSLKDALKNVVEQLNERGDNSQLLSDWKYCINMTQLNVQVICVA